MAQQKRKAKLTSTLVFADEPQLIHLLSRQTHVIAVAIPCDDDGKSMFLAATVHPNDWQDYLDGVVDLRYLFVYPRFRNLYTFNIKDINQNEIVMFPFDGDAPEEYLPQPRFFSENHTEEFDVAIQIKDTESLVVDGSWDMPEFGDFYQRYSEIYAFIVATANWKAENIAEAVKGRIRNTFRGKPFQGGFSYVHFYKGLIGSLQRGERLGLNEIQYASPGFVNINGRGEVFSEIENIIPNYLQNRIEIQKLYVALHGYLSENYYLKMAGENYPQDDPTAPFILDSASKLADAMRAPDIDAVNELAEGNALVVAKIVLSFGRRLEEAANYFAQGRVTFT